MKQYDRFIKDADGKYFSDPDTAGYHFYSRKDETERKNLYRYEEVTGKQFGLLYRSDYSTLLVDPVTRKDGSGLMTYERVLPGKLLASRYDGVVIVPRINDRYVLIRQYRHALRRDQLCFPRGYAENDDIFLDAERELKEEIGGVLKSGSALTLLGSYTADSGLSSKTTAIVLAELDSYSSSDDPDEAINTIEEYTLDKLTALFRSGEIDDGFTIASLLSLREYQKPQGTV